MAYKKTPIIEHPLDFIMLALCIIALLLFVNDKEWLSALWVVITIMWVLIARQRMYKE